MTNTELRRLAEKLSDVDFSWRVDSLADVIIALLDRCEALEKERDEALSCASDGLAKVESFVWSTTDRLRTELCEAKARIDELEREKSDLMRGSANALEVALRAHAAKGGE